MTGIERTRGDIARQPHMKPGEVFFMNEIKNPNPDAWYEPTITLDELVRNLLNSGKFESVRVVTMGAYTTNGKHLPDLAAILVVPKQQTEQQ